MKSVFLPIFGSAIALAQPISFGVKAGVPFTDFIHTVSGSGADTATKRYIVGPTVEFNLPGFSIEVDALYRRFNYDTSSTLAGNVVSNFRTTGDAWEFPLLVKKRFGFGPVKPFIDGGLNFNRISGLTQTVRTVASTVTNSNPPELKNDFSTGITIGAGLDIRALFLRVSPEIRYTRWNTEQFSSGSVNSNRNQAEFLVGITF